MSTYNEKDIMVSIVCNTYNQEIYIADALDSFLMQKTNFAFEILVHDDASTDNTSKIIKEYEKKYPNLIKPIYQVVNQYSQNINICINFQYPRVRGKYVAFCEGDDYWTDPLKLQKQFDAMEAHPEIDMCAHRASEVVASTKEYICDIAPHDNDCILTIEEIIECKNNVLFLATNSLFYRATLDKNMPKFRKFFAYDYTLRIHGAMRGGILYLNDNMSCYRVMAKNSFSERMKKDKSALAKHRAKVAKFLEILDEETNYVYHDVIETRNLQNELRASNGKGILKKRYRKIFRQYPLSVRLKIRLDAYFPWLKKLKSRSQKDNKTSK